MDMWKVFNYCRVTIDDYAEEACQEKSDFDVVFTMILCGLLSLVSYEGNIHSYELK